MGINKIIVLGLLLGVSLAPTGGRADTDENLAMRYEHPTLPKGEGIVAAYSNGLRNIREQRAQVAQQKRFRADLREALLDALAERNHLSIIEIDESITLQVGMESQVAIHEITSALESILNQPHISAIIVKANSGAKGAVQKSQLISVPSDHVNIASMEREAFMRGREYKWATVVNVKAVDGHFEIVQ